jgi:hypothetical protein
MEKILLSQDSTIEVYNPSIKFFLDKIEAGEYFSFTRQLHGFWDTIIAAMILDKELRHIRKYDDDYLLRLSDAMIQAKHAMQPFRYDRQLYFDVLKNIINLDKADKNFFYGVSDIDFYSHDDPPYSVNSYASFFPSHRLLPTRDRLRCYRIRCGDRQEMIRFLLPEGYIPFNGIIWRKYGYSGQLHNFIDEIKKSHHLVVVGPAQFRQFDEFLKLPDYHHIEIHNTEAYKDRMQLVDLLTSYHRDHSGDRPVVYFIVAGTLGVWLVSRLHNHLEKTFLIDVGLAIDPLLPQDRITQRNQYHFFYTASRRSKYWTDNKYFFVNKDLGHRIEIGHDGLVTFHMPSISRMKCYRLTLKTRIEYFIAYKLKLFNLKRFRLVNSLTRFYWKVNWFFSG